MPPAADHRDPSPRSHPSDPFRSTGRGADPSTWR
jgi:hypothetical protein